MIQENEVVMFFLGLGVLFFLMFNLGQIKRITGWRILMGAFYLLLGGWFLTVIEHVAFADASNFLEHVCYLGSSILIAVWCRKVFRKEEN
jgi:hypothetical protein